MADNSPPITLLNHGEESDDSDCNGFLLVGVMLFFLGISIITIALCYFNVHFNLSITLTQARRLRRRTRAGSRARRFSLRSPVFDFSTSATEGLRREVVDALPVFVYRLEVCREGLSCAVCLSELEENEKAKMLPNCNHSFHAECVDMWFCSHSTCPLCRAHVEKQPDLSVEISVEKQCNEHVEVSNGEEVNGKEMINSKSSSSASGEDEEAGVRKEERVGVTIDID